ncbi:hypothetical protein BH24ACI2_BH24ACI2_15280 [soil metagenome]|jgi:hypothetical protein|nr:hypothetical protein [Acidobacteriota bacterium]
MADIFDEFQNLIARINQEQIDYAVCGGWAMAIHGSPRATVVIDLLVLSENLEQVWKIAEDLGYWVEGLPLSFDQGIIEIRRISKIDEETKTLFTIDFLLVTEALKQVWETRENIDFEDDKVWTVSREGLIFMKQLSGRHKDLGDIESLMELENES